MATRQPERNDRDMSKTTTPEMPIGGAASRPQRLVRTPDGKIAGVAADISYYLGVDPTIVRIASSSVFRRRDRDPALSRLLARHAEGGDLGGRQRPQGRSLDGRGPRSPRARGRHPVGWRGSTTASRSPRAWPSSAAGLAPSPRPLAPRDHRSRLRPHRAPRFSTPRGSRPRRAGARDGSPGSDPRHRGGGSGRPREPPWPRRPRPAC